MSKIFILLGSILITVGVFWGIAEKIGLGRLPGDISIQKGNASFYFPIVSSLVISIVLTLLLNLVRYFRG